MPELDIHPLSKQLISPSHVPKLEIDMQVVSHQFFDIILFQIMKNNCKLGISCVNIQIIQSHTLSITELRKNNLKSIWESFTS